MTLVLIDDSQFLFLIIGIAVCILAVIASNAIWAIWEIWLTPKESKMLRKASRKKRALIVLASDDGNYDFNYLDRLGDEGRAKTNSKWAGFLPRSQREQQISLTAEIPDKATEQEKKEIAQGVEDAKQLAEFISTLNIRKGFLRHARVPIWFGYSGKAILTSLFGLVGLEMTENLIADPEKTKALPKDHFWSVDIQQIKSLFSLSWNQAQIRAHEIDFENIGYQRASKKMKTREGLLMLAIACALPIALGILLIVISKVM